MRSNAPHAPGVRPSHSQRAVSSGVSASVSPACGMLDHVDEMNIDLWARVLLERLRRRLRGECGGPCSEQKIARPRTAGQGAASQFDELGVRHCRGRSAVLALSSTDPVSAARRMSRAAAPDREGARANLAAWPPSLPFGFSPMFLQIGSSNFLTMCPSVLPRSSCSRQSLGPPRWTGCAWRATSSGRRLARRPTAPSFCAPTEMHGEARR